MIDSSQAVYESLNGGGLQQAAAVTVRVGMHGGPFPARKKSESSSRVFFLKTCHARTKFVQSTKIG